MPALMPPTPSARRLLRGAVLVAGATALIACSNLSEREAGTAKGAAIGAVAGAVVGSATKGSVGKSAAIGGALGAVAGNLWSKHLEDKRAALEKASAGTGVSVERTADNRLRVNVPADASFDVGSATLQPALRPVLDELARNPDPSTVVTVTGHTDATGSQASNNLLAQQRADAVRRYLIDRGMPAQRISAVSRGEEQPLASNATEAGRAMNRRVEITMSQGA